MVEKFLMQTGNYVIYNICNDCMGIGVCNKAGSFAKMSATL